MKRSLFVHMAWLVMGIAIVNTIATKFFWYSSLWWFDMPMHFLGGFFVAGMTAFFFWNNEYRALWVLCGVLVVGVGWEVFEIGVDHVTFALSITPIDSLSDIFFDLAGGTALLLWIREKSVY